MFVEDVEEDVVNLVELNGLLGHRLELRESVLEMSEENTCMVGLGEGDLQGRENIDALSHV